MALIDIDPSIVGAFVPTNALLEHKDTIGTAFWNQFVENGIAAYSLWRTALAHNTVMAWTEDLYCQIPPVNPSTYYANKSYTENAAIRIGFTWTGNLPRGTVTLYGGTSLLSMGSLWSYEISASSGSHFASLANPIVVPQYSYDDPLNPGEFYVLATPYFLRVSTVQVGITYFSDIHIQYKKYPVFS